MNIDAVRAVAHLADRAGAKQFEMGHLNTPRSWWASVLYVGAKVTVEGHESPSAAAHALAERLLTGATCRCGKPVTIDDGVGCRWRLMGPRWEPGCDAAPIAVEGKHRGDVEAMRAALEEKART